MWYVMAPAPHCVSALFLPAACALFSGWAGTGYRRHPSRSEIMKTVVHYKVGPYLPLVETWIHGQIANLKRYQPSTYISMDTCVDDGLQLGNLLKRKEPRPKVIGTADRPAFIQRGTVS